MLGRIAVTAITMALLAAPAVASAQVTASLYLGKVKPSIGTVSAYDGEGTLTKLKSNFREGFAGGFRLGYQFFEFFNIDVETRVYQSYGNVTGLNFCVVGEENNVCQYEQGTSLRLNVSTVDIFGTAAVPLESFEVYAGGGPTIQWEGINLLNNNEGIGGSYRGWQLLLGLRFGITEEYDNPYTQVFLEYNLSRTASLMNLRGRTASLYHRARFDGFTHLVLGGIRAVF